MAVVALARDTSESLASESSFELDGRGGLEAGGLRWVAGQLRGARVIAGPEPEAEDHWWSPSAVVGHSGGGIGASGAIIAC